MFQIGDESLLRRGRKIDRFVRRPNARENLHAGRSALQNFVHAAPPSQHVDDAAALGGLAEVGVAAVVQIGVDEDGATSPPRKRHRKVGGDGGRTHSAFAAAGND